MRQVILVQTTPGRVEILTNFLQSIKNYDGKYPLFIESAYNYSWFDFVTHHEFDEILILHDSVEIKDLSLFDLVFDKYKGRSVSFTGMPYFVMEMGKYKRKPYLESIFEGSETYKGRGQNEFQFGPAYVKNSNEVPVVLFPNMMECEWPGNKKKRKFHWKFNRGNLVLENQYIRKYKGHWAECMIRTLDKDGYIIKT
jgi:hypothetical protein